MDWKLFFSTFLLIFLAELGDKTQLASLAASATSKSPWSIFVAASLALVLSTFIAVLVGSLMGKYLPQKLIKIIAAILFLLFGIFMLYSAFKKEEAPEFKTQQVLKTGFVVKLALKIAKQFEIAKIKTYEKLLNNCRNSALQQCFAQLIIEEKNHIHEINQIVSNKELLKVKIDYDLSNHPVCEVKPLKISYTDKDQMKKLIKIEENTAHFYEQLSKVVHINTLKQVFLQLSLEEKKHVKMLKKNWG